MNKQAVAFVFAVLVVFALLSICAEGDAEGVSAPQYTNYIRADGSVEGTGSIQRAGEEYTFLGNVSGSLCVERDNIVIDGAGFALHGSNDSRVSGIALVQRHNVTVKNVSVVMNGFFGIDLSNASDCKIIESRFVGVPSSSPSSEDPVASSARGIGMNIRYSSNNFIQGNHITNCSVGIFLDSSYNNSIIANDVSNGLTGINLSNTTNNSLRHNRMSNNIQSFFVYAFPVNYYPLNDDVDTSNTIDGKPIYYLINEQDKTVPTNAALAVLVNCTNMVVRDFSLEVLILASTTNSTISNITITKELLGVGIVLLKCSKVHILESVIENRSVGIVLDSSSGNVIAGCTIVNCSYRGINVANSNNNLISGNNITDNAQAIALYTDQPSSGNIFSENNFTDNDNALRLSGGNFVSGNIFAENNYALECMGGQNNITWNTFKNNGQAIHTSGENNILRNNRMENNTSNLFIADLISIDNREPYTFNLVPNDIDSSNTVDGKPIYYWRNEHDKTVPLDASSVILVSCRNITVQNLSIAASGQGIVLIYATDSIVKNNVITSNNFYGVGLFASSKNTISENLIIKNYWGMSVGNSFSNTIVNNTFSENNGFAIIFAGNQKDNIIHHNNFINNKVAPMLQISIDKMSGPGWGNRWDDGNEGNYWSDYQTRYTNASDIDNSGIGNTPFVINENNIDYHPLMKPVVNSNIPASAIPTAMPTSSPQTTPTQEPSLMPNLTSPPSTEPAIPPTPFGEHNASNPNFPSYETALVTTTVISGLVAFVLWKRRKK